MKTKIALFIALLTLPVVSYAQGSYKRPPQEILDVLNAPEIPTTSVSPTRDKIALTTVVRNPPISYLSQPVLRIAGIRINPNTNGRHRQQYSDSLTIKNISDGKETRVAFPGEVKLFGSQWAPDGKHLAVANITPSGIELWIVDTATARAEKVKNVWLNTTLANFDWDDSSTISAFIVPANRGPAPKYQDVVPTEPAIQETSGRISAIQTFEDLLKNPNDEKLFEYYATSQIALIEVGGKVRTVGHPAIYTSADFSPDGKYSLVQTVQRPFSYQFPFGRFPRNVEVWDANGRVVTTVAKVPLSDNLPSGAVQTGPRSVGWIPTEPATLIWAEALDGGDPKKKVPARDHLMTLAAPFTGQAIELLKTEQRYQGRAFGEKAGMMLYYDTNRDTQHRRTFLTDYHNTANPKLIADLNTRDRYADIGQPVTKQLPNGSNVIRQVGDEIYLQGTGASAEGDRPFLRRLNLTTLKTTELFRSSKDDYESFVAMVNDESGTFITRRESPTDPPNLLLRQVCPEGKICTAMSSRPLTEFKDPTPQLRGITKQLVKYKRADGVDLSFTLYLPPGYKQGTRLPTVVWAYPLEFTDDDLAGQVSGSTRRFTTISAYSHLFFALQGYAVLDNATMPIVGNPQTVNDTFVKQVVDSAAAAIDKAVEMGVTDRDRVGVGGHSYGAFMTGNLLAHSDLFRAGIARSGAYNRTLTPFGFQSEQRTFWEAPEMYEKVSPFFYADKIKEPILMIHGEADDNTGTFPIQSERLYAAISGLGGTARLVMLPLEAHGYTAKESTQHTLYEMITWFDKYVKNAKPRDSKNMGGDK